MLFDYSNNVVTPEHKTMTYFNQSEGVQESLQDDAQQLVFHTSEISN